MRTSGRVRTLVATGAVAALLLTPAAAHAAARSGTLTLVDVAADGTPGNGYDSGLDMSDDGRYVAFASNSSNLVAGDTNETYDVFVRDLRTHRTTLVSGGLDGQPANDYVEGPVISGNGRYVAFTSYASNLVPDDTNGERDVFVHDMKTGVTTRASVATGNVQLDGFQYGPSISDNGRYVTFIQTDDGQRLFVHDMKTGVTQPLTPPGWDWSVYEAAISGNGRRVVFSGSGDFAGDGGSGGIFRYDRGTGVSVRVSPETVGGAPVDAFAPTIDRDGTKVGYITSAAIDPSDTNGLWDLYVRDLSADSTALVSVNRAGTGAGNAETFDGALSADGRYAGFPSLASDLVADDTNGTVNDIFLRDLRTGRTTLVTASPSGGSGNALSWDGIPSADGSRVLFSSVATNLGVDPGDGNTHLFVRCLRNC